jgi:hypothetical protein
VWVSKDNRITYIREMDDDHLVNTILFLHRRAIDLKPFNLSEIIQFRAAKMKKEARGRRLLPRVMLALDDVRGLVRATKELHSLSKETTDAERE